MHLKYSLCLYWLSAFCLLWVTQRQHTQCAAIQVMLLPVLSPCTILPPLSIGGLFPSQRSRCLCGPTNNSHARLQQIANTPGNTASRVSCLSSETHNRAKSEQSQGDCNNQPKWLGEEEKPYHAFCESLKHFDDLESNFSALTKVFYKKQSCSFCCLNREAQTEEKYLR